jgi:hypothetical protein
MIAVLAVQPLLGQDPPAPAQGPEFGGSSPIGLVVTLFMLIALVFLIRSMNKHLRKVPPSFDPPDTEESSDAPGASASGSGGAAAAAADRPSSGSAPNSTPKS